MGSCQVLEERVVSMHCAFKQYITTCACIYTDVIAIRFKKLSILIFDSVYVRVGRDFWSSYSTIFTIFLHSVVKLFLCLTGDKFIAHQNAFTCEEKGVG